MTAARRLPASRIRPHLFLEDPDEPRDYRDRSVCHGCGLVGEPGDGRHPRELPVPAPRPWPPALAEAARERDAAILGERDDE